MVLKNKVKSNENEISRLPAKLLASKIFSYLPGAQRQRIRAVCMKWKVLIDDYYGIKVQVTDANWKWVQSNNRIICARMANLKCEINVGTGPRVPLTISLRVLEVLGQTSFDILLPILKQCLNLRNLTLTIPAKPFSIPHPMNKTPYSYDGMAWLPELVQCKLVICAPDNEQDYRKQMVLLETVFMVLASTEIEQLDMIANGSDWSLPLAHMFLIQLPYNNIFWKEIDLSRVKFLPMHLLQGSLTSISFQNDFQVQLGILIPPDRSYGRYKSSNSLMLDYIDFQIGSGNNWLSSAWDAILKKQRNLLELVYEIHYANEMRTRVLNILNNNDMLRILIFHGKGLGREPFDGGWFHKLSNLKRLELLGEKSDDQIFFSRFMPMLTRPWYLPTSLRTLVVHGYIDCGRVDLGTALENLDNLLELELMGRYKNPWFLSNWKPIFDVNSCLLHELHESLQRLEYLKLFWIKPRKGRKAGASNQAYIQDGLGNWCENKTNDLRMRTFEYQNGTLCSEVRRRTH